MQIISQKYSYDYYLNLYIKTRDCIQEYLVIKSQKSANSLTGNGKTRERESALFFNNLTDYFILVNHRRNTFRSFLFNNKFYYAKIKTDCKYLLFDDNFCITY